ncbi:MAG: phosphate signaling complex protein PhoU [Caldilineales bacterium]|nr:phosphate signaling complex protein PhoU [Caldilineales bacterium]
MRERFLRQLEELRDDVLKMGVLVEDEMKLALAAYEELNLEKAREAATLDQNVNHARFDIEGRCFALLVTQQPAAGDLRHVVAALNIIVDLERMGDQAKGIARVVERIHSRPPQVKPIEIRQMGQRVLAMLHVAMQAYANENTNLARSLYEKDDDVDALYARAFSEVMDYMAGETDKSQLQSAYEIIRVTRELERFGDLAVNLGERTIYMVTGSLEELDGEEDD